MKGPNVKRQDFSLVLKLREEYECKLVGVQYNTFKIFQDYLNNPSAKRRVTFHSKYQNIV